MYWRRRRCSSGEMPASASESVGETAGRGVWSEKETARIDEEGVWACGAAGGGAAIEKEEVGGGCMRTVGWREMGTETGRERSWSVGVYAAWKRPETWGVAGGVGCGGEAGTKTVPRQ
jgi:hypothetical protein